MTLRLIVARWVVHYVNRDGNARVTDVNATAGVTARTSDKFFNLRIVLPAE